jgi:hypothetical protein
MFRIGYCIRFLSGCSVFTRRFPVTASKNGYSSASVLKSTLKSGSLPNELRQVKVKVKVTLRLAVYSQSVGFGVKPPETHDQRFFFPNESLR